MEASGQIMDMINSKAMNFVYDRVRSTSHSYCSVDFVEVKVKMYLLEYVCGLFGRSMLYALVELPSE